VCRLVSNQLLVAFKWGDVAITNDRESAWYLDGTRSDLS
jgi:hypothetical protein